MLFFADSYALIDFAKGNPVYEKYFKEHEIITTKMNLFELYYAVLADGSKENAGKYFDFFLAKTVQPADLTIKKAAQFKFSHKKQNISYIDALGYETAYENQVKFLTGDRQFEQLPNVEFVK